MAIFNYIKIQAWTKFQYEFEIMRVGIFTSKQMNSKKENVVDLKEELTLTKCWTVQKNRVGNLLNQCHLNSLFTPNWTSSLANKPLYQGFQTHVPHYFPQSIKSLKELFHNIVQFNFYRKQFVLHSEITNGIQSHSVIMVTVIMNLRLKWTNLAQLIGPNW